MHFLAAADPDRQPKISTLLKRVEVHDFRTFQSFQYYCRLNGAAQKSPSLPLTDPLFHQYLCSTVKAAPFKRRLPLG